MITLIKILTWLASPIGLLVSLSLAAALLLAHRKAPKTRVLLITLAIGQLVLFAFPPVATQLSQGLEHKAQALQAQNTGGPYTAILLLGGGITPALPDQTPANAHEAFDRVMYAAQLYQQGLAPKVIASGGTGLREAYPEAQSEAQAMATALILMGVPQTAILLEGASLTTRQNMAHTAQLMQQQGLTGKLALVTSATHMPRAVANARNAGINVDAYPTDWTPPLRYKPFALRWLPNAQDLEASERALKEWVAFLLQY